MLIAPLLFLFFAVPHTLEPNPGQVRLSAAAVPAAAAKRTQGLTMFESIALSVLERVLGQCAKIAHTRSAAIS